MTNIAKTPASNGAGFHGSVLPNLTVKTLPIQTVPSPVASSLVPVPTVTPPPVHIKVAPVSTARPVVMESLIPSVSPVTPSVAQNVQPTETKE